jgi:D-arginine dehydrogenase
MSDFDIAIVGAGIAGASIAAELAGHANIVLIEGEAQPGYHSTGRSAAFWSEIYGGPGVQPLTKASGPFLAQPAADFSVTPFLSPRGALHIGTARDKAVAAKIYADFQDSSINIGNADAAFIKHHVPAIRSGWDTGIWEPDCCDIDVASLHAAYLRDFKRKSGKLLCNARLTKARFHNRHWQIDTRGQNFTANILINAAGAWADQVAGLAGVKPIGITPHRRTIAVLSVDPAPPRDMPLIIGLDGSFYFKPEAGGRIWLSPHDETPTEACDAAPDELDIAKAIERLKQVVDWNILRLEKKWAGLRSFAPDRLPVIGRDTECPEFFWMAGQGGFGIQTAPAAAKMAASLLLGIESQLPSIDPAVYDPARFDHSRI